MILSIIVPTYNEEKTIIKILEKIKNNSSDFFKYEVIVIDDASTDQSRKLLENNKHLYGYYCHSPRPSEAHHLNQRLHLEIFGQCYLRGLCGNSHQIQ